MTTMGKRLESLDILRGADLFFLLVIGPVVKALEKVLEGGEAFFRQFHHVNWEGFVAWAGYPILIAIGNTAILTVILMLMYKRKVFLKV